MLLCPDGHYTPESATAGAVKVGEGRHPAVIVVSSHTILSSTKNLLGPVDSCTRLDTRPKVLLVNDVFT